MLAYVVISEAGEDSLGMVGPGACGILQLFRGAADRWRVDFVWCQGDSVACGDTSTGSVLRLERSALSVFADIIVVPLRTIPFANICSVCEFRG